MSYLCTGKGRRGIKDIREEIEEFSLTLCLTLRAVYVRHFPNHSKDQYHAFFGETKTINYCSKMFPSSIF